MQSNAVRVGLGLGAVAAIVVLFVVLSGDGDESGGSNTTTTPATAQAVETVVVSDGQPVSGVRKLMFKKGERIRFIVQTNGGDEVHLHGYDIDKPVPAAGGKVSFDVPADLDGVFEVELHLHEGEAQIAEVTVEP